MTQPPTGLPSRPTCRGTGPHQALGAQGSIGCSRQAGPAAPVYSQTGSTRVQGSSRSAGNPPFPWRNSPEVRSTGRSRGDGIGQRVVRQPALPSISPHPHSLLATPHASLRPLPNVSQYPFSGYRRRSAYGDDLLTFEPVAAMQALCLGRDVVDRRQPRHRRPALAPPVLGGRAIAARRQVEPRHLV